MTYNEVTLVISRTRISPGYHNRYLDSHITLTGFVKATVDHIQHLSTQNMQQKWGSPVIRINIVTVLIAPLIIFKSLPKRK